MVDPSLDALLDPEFIGSLSSLPIEELRARRSRAAAVEIGLSYARRLVQGHVDILIAEAGRRAEGSSPTDVSSLIEHLPEILADRVRTPGNGRLLTLLAPDSQRAQVSRVDTIVDAVRLVDLPSLDDAGLSASKEALLALERDVSRERRALHEVMDCLQQELIRRYKAGEVTVESLLQ
jgi:hypothetical protein